MVPASLIVAQARRYLGVRFAHQGRSVAGMDCAGLVVRVTADLGAPVGDILGYGRTPNAGQLRQHMDSHGPACAPGTQPVPGMVALMRFESEPQHVAIVGDHPDGLSLIHALSAMRRVVEHRLDPLWQTRILALYKIPGVEY